MAPDLAFQARSRRSNSFSNSISSDRPSATGYGGLISPPATILPDPAFIAASAASQIVTNDHDSQSDSWLDQHGIEPSGETALVTPAALKLVNRFLDQLLFNFLAVSKSTSLASLRPAVIEVLKTKLAKDAINGAEQELHEYLGGGDDDELMAFHNGLESSSNWDLELIWKRTRLRCMVYSSLGDMEEEDEDHWTEMEHLEDSSSTGPGVVSPAVAIFLTSVLEFMGEQVLVVAGQTAYQRLRTKLEKEARDGTSTLSDIAERVVVDENDTERDSRPTLERLEEAPTLTCNIYFNDQPPFPRDSLPAGQSDSIAIDDDLEDSPKSLAAVLTECELAAGVPLPLSSDDVREIEIPGLALQIDDEEGEEHVSDEEVQRPRPKSFILFTHGGIGPTTPTLPHDVATLSSNTRKRSHSLPTPSQYSKRQKPSVETEGNDTTAYGSNRDDPTQDGERSQSESKGVMAGVVAGMTAAGAAAVAGITAMANGGAPQTEFHSKLEVDPEEFVEEPKIMTSSRISIDGCISPIEQPKAVSSCPATRTSSTHSIRVIDVPSRSPLISQASSGEGSDYVSGRPLIISPSSSVKSSFSDSQTPKVASPVSRLSNSSPQARRDSLVPMHTRSSAGGSISEAEELNEPESAPITAVPSDLAAAMAGVDFYPSPTTPQFSSSKEDASPPTPPGTFVLSPAPASRQSRESISSLERQVSQTSQPNQRSGVISRSPAVENGVPPLTPLRELVEVAQDTSDEASSIAPSNDNLSVLGHSRSISGSTSTLSYMQRAGDQQRPARGYPSSTPLNSQPRPTREDMAQKAPERPRGHRSASTSSSASHKVKAMRSSEDSTPSVADDKGRSFEQLIRSDQTIQYTLTPENMRNIESPDSSRHGFPLVSTANDGGRPPSGRSHSSSVTKLSALRSNPPVDGSIPAPKSPQLSQQHKPVSINSSRTAGTRVRSNTPQARDARVDRDSIGDFADFIRSTGPAESYEPSPPRSVLTHRGTDGSTRNVSGTSSRIATPSTLPRRSESTIGRAKLQARNATITKGDSISDLIDFVRSGPQLDNDKHRIPRTVAPFRTTMDSDQMSASIGGRAIDAALPDSRYSQASASVDSSVNSQSALLSHASKNKALPTQNLNNFDEVDMMPKRKTRRVRDPYAIDFSDDDDEFEAAAPRAKTKPIQEEESLADFLRNVPPPPEPPMARAFESASKQNGKTGVLKKASTTSLMSRFSRRESGPQIPPKPKTSGHDSVAPRVRRPSYTPIAAKYTTTSVPASNQKLNSDDYSSQVDSARNRMQKKSYQPREAVLPSSRGTDDLADFLMKSEPPMQSKPQLFTPTLQKEEANAFQRMFGRKKVT
ncbi:hypothetical protein LOCC1_G000645 [Lachnellula occidentalis]|uniref:Uncharacterized protein n=1 Tax=Lachnellula occidentalis TaxID=215460 RepID=A0A8H8UKQ5_9HELO|nr:hypothetical protein LOCC1_G000645 [Lachnellula occidentalis]